MVSEDIPPFNPSEFAQTLLERVAVQVRRGGAAREITHPAYLLRLLCIGGERRKSETDSENDREPDQSHGP
jgi:hypothetical protein